MISQDPFPKAEKRGMKDSLFSFSKPEQIHWPIFFLSLPSHFGRMENDARRARKEGRESSNGCGNQEKVTAKKSSLVMELGMI